MSSDPLNHADLELSIGNLKRKLEVLSPLDQEILELTDNSAIEKEIDHTGQYQENVQRVMAVLNKALSVSALTPRTSTTTDSSEIESSPVCPWE